MGQGSQNGDQGRKDEDGYEEWLDPSVGDTFSGSGHEVHSEGMGVDGGIRSVWGRDNEGG